MAFHKITPDIYKKLVTLNDFALAGGIRDRRRQGEWNMMYFGCFASILYRAFEQYL